MAVAGAPVSPSAISHNVYYVKYSAVAEKNRHENCPHDQPARNAPMSRPRSRLIGWNYDDQRQEIHAPSGQIITLANIAQRQQDDLACNYDFNGPWSGWRMRGDRLTPPHTGKNLALKPYTAPLFTRWVNDAMRSDQRTEQARPRPILICTNYR